MSLRDQLRADAKMDSRRFGKSIVCRIVHGPLLSFIEQKGLIPNVILINNDTGLDPINNKMVVIPVSKYSQILELLQNYDVTVSQGLDVNDDTESFEKLLRINEEIIVAIQQNMILVTVSSVMPEGISAGVSPQLYDVLIDSIDVNQAIEAVYVHRSVRNLRETKKQWNKK